MSSFGERLRTLRKERSISQLSLAKYLGVSERALQNYETGEREAKLSLLQDCADFFGVSIDYLAGKTEDPKPPRDTNISPEEAEFLKWVDENLEEAFFHDFDKSPNEAKAQLMKDLRYMWEREKKGRV